MKRPSRKQIKLWNKQRGMTLMELLVAGVISLIAASGMVIVMANTLGTGSKTIQMAKVTQEMRTAMQIMSRELRRANYHSDFMACYGNPNCLTTLGFLNKVGEINIVDNGNSDCLYFWYDRPQVGAVTADPVAAFRRTTVTLSGLTVGVLEMTANSAPAFDDSKCNPTYTSDWTAITDPELIDVLTFNVDDTDSTTEVINLAGDIQSIERIGLTITARLTNDTSLPTWLQGNTTERELREFIAVRNHTTSPPASP